MRTSTRRASFRPDRVWSSALRRTRA